MMQPLGQVLETGVSFCWFHGAITYNHLSSDCNVHYCVDVSLQVFERLGATNEVSLHLVEVSPHLSQVQSKTLCVTAARPLPPTGPYYQSGVTATNVPVFWYSSIQDVPQQFSCFLAHEFFDALPIHKFQARASVWRCVWIPHYSALSLRDIKQFSFVFVHWYAELG